MGMHELKAGGLAAAAERLEATPAISGEPQFHVGSDTNNGRIGRPPAVVNEHLHQIYRHRAAGYRHKTAGPISISGVAVFGLAGGAPLPGEAGVARSVDAVVAHTRLGRGLILDQSINHTGIGGSQAVALDLGWELVAMALPGYAVVAADPDCQDRRGIRARLLISIAKSIRADAVGDMGSGFGGGVVEAKARELASAREGVKPAVRWADLKGKGIQQGTPCGAPVVCVAMIVTDGQDDVGPGGIEAQRRSS